MHIRYQKKIAVSLLFHIAGRLSCNWVFSFATFGYLQYLDLFSLATPCAALYVLHFSLEDFEVNHFIVFIVHSITTCHFPFVYSQELNFFLQGFCIHCFLEIGLSLL